MNAASIGLGWWSDELAAAIQGRSELVRVVSCYSRSRDKRIAFSRKFDTGHHDSFSDVLSDDEIDAVILSTPHSLHADQVVQAAEAGKHVFVEKPFTLSVESARKAMDACSESGVVLAVGHNRRFASSANRLFRMQENGEFGTLLHLEANFSASGALAYTSKKWRASRIESPAGGIAGLGIHLIDTICRIAGPIVRVHAQATRRAVPVDIDDTTSALFAFESGATGYLGCAFACPYTCFVNVYGRDANAFAQIDGEKLQVHYAGKRPEIVPLSRVDTLLAEIEEFALACRGERTYRISPAQAACNVAVMEAIAKSAEIGAAVETDESSRSAWKHRQ